MTVAVLTCIEIFCDGVDPFGSKCSSIYPLRDGQVQEVLKWAAADGWTHDQEHNRNLCSLCAHRL